MEHELLTLILGLTKRDHRQANATLLARFLKADDLVIFIYDSTAKTYLPVLGFRQTFPEGKNLKNFLEECSKNGQHQSTFRFILNSKDEQNIRGYLTSDGSIVVFSGGNPTLANIAEICHLMPLINFGYKCERDLHSTSAQSQIIANAMNESEAYAKALDLTRKQLETTVAELRKSEVIVRTLADNSQKALESLKHEKDLREQFVATLTHDLRSPITAARMSAQIIMRKSSPDENGYVLAGRVINSIDRVDQMIQNLLDANLIRAGQKLPLEFKDCDIREVIKDTLDELTTTHGDRFIFFAKEELQVFWSCSSIRRVIENLVNNGIKYGYAYRPITVKLNEMLGEKIEISVHNEGHPLSREEQSSIFEPYKRTDSAMTGKQQGWGLGLTLVKGIVEAHNGEIFIESAPDKGTTFTILIPRVPMH